MRVETLGDGEPEVAVVGAVHGDEPCGARAIERFLSEDHEDEIQRPVKLIVANERALERGVRGTEADLNRLLPGDPDSDVYEERLAYELVEETEGCACLGIHSTVSYGDPFGALSHPTEEKEAVFRALGDVHHVMDATLVSDGSRCVDRPRFVDIEAGLQGSDEAAENAYDCMLDFLRFYDVLPGDTEPTETTFYEVFDLVWKEAGYTYQFLGENFERVAEGEVYARRDGEELRADREFWPILMSDTGHDELFGYRSRVVETVD